MTTTTDPADEYPEIKSQAQRAQEAIEQKGGLPEDNPFTDLIKSLRENDKSWEEIWEVMDDAYRVVDAACFEETTIMEPEWEVTIDKLPHEPNEQHLNFTRIGAETKEEAKEKITTDGEIVSVEQVGVTKYS